MNSKPRISPELAHRRRQLKEQQAALQRGETPPQIEPYDFSLRCTQVSTRYPDGNQQEASRTSGSHPELKEVRSEVVTREHRCILSPDHNRSVTVELPIEEYIQLAAAKNAEALEATSTWQGSAWTFCRYLKGHSTFEGLSAQQAVDHLDEILERMYPSAEDPWAEVFDCVDSTGNPHDPFDHLIECWDAVENELGESPMEKALRLAEQHPLVLVGYRSKRWKRYRLFLSICRWLQVITQGEPFFAPVRKFAAVIGVRPTSISNYRKRAERDGYLVKVKEHEGRRKATEFRFNLEALKSEIATAKQTADGEWGEIE